MDEPSQKIGKKIRSLREHRNWLQRDLAQASNLQVRTIGRIERGEVDVRISTLTRIVDALEISLSSFFT